MNHIRDIIHRLRAGESERRIARDLQLSRPTIHKYRVWAESKGYLRPEHPLPDAATVVAALGQAPQPPKMISSLEPYREAVQRLVNQGVELQAIWQRLQENYGYQGSYSAVRRFVRWLRPTSPTPVIRVHTAPGEELQVDFGSIGVLFDPIRQQPRPAYAFVATLSYSRHQYATLVFDQKTATWLRLHRLAFEHFGGVPRRVVPDNLKPAVLQALVLDAVLGEAYRRLALHYGFLVSPTRPGTPQHKGKVESGIHYLQRNFMAGQTFVDITSANQHLQAWVRDTAGMRVHGTTHQVPWHCFTTVEQATLLPLPATPFTLLEIKPVKVHPDCHVVIDGSYYSVPYRYIGQKLEAHISDTLVELYCATVLVVTHLRSLQPGQWRTRLEDYPPGKAAYLQRTPQYCRQVADQVGPATRQVVETLLADRPLDRLRAVQAILRLAEAVGHTRLEAACARALYFGDVRYRRIKQILNAALDRDPLPAAPTLSRTHQTYAFARPSTAFFPAEPEAQVC